MQWGHIWAQNLRYIIYSITLRSLVENPLRILITLLRSKCCITELPVRVRLIHNYSYLNSGDWVLYEFLRAVQ